jgi:hypothetical protein
VGGIASDWTVVDDPCRTWKQLKLASVSGEKEKVEVVIVEELILKLV